MSSKFSRRSTRVQHKPHVCISDPPPPSPEPTVKPQTLVMQITWAVFDTGMGVSSFNNFITVDRGASPQTYTAIINDDQGFSGTVRLELPDEPPQSTITVDWTMSEVGAYTLTGQANGWPGDLLTLVNPFLLARGGPPEGSGDWQHP